MLVLSQFLNSTCPYLGAGGLVPNKVLFDLMLGETGIVLPIFFVHFYDNLLLISLWLAL